MRIRRTSDVQLVESLHGKCLPDDDWDEPTAMWVADLDGRIAGFCSANLLTHENGVFLHRAGVLPWARGNGLQRRMVRVREQWARNHGREYAVTYTTPCNHASLANLIRCGYRLYHPAWPWAGKEMLYYVREL